jgi:hypothetical protein
MRYHRTFQSAGPTPQVDFLGQKEYISEGWSRKGCRPEQFDPLVSYLWYGISDRIALADSAAICGASLHPLSFNLITTILNSQAMRTMGG